MSHKIHPSDKIKLELLEYEDYYDIPMRPSEIINDDENYETGSDSTGYDENMDIKVINLRRKSTVDNYINKFNKLILNQNSNLIPVKTKNKCCFNFFRKKY